MRAAAVWALVLVQAEFLWLGEFHRHDEQQARYGATAPLLGEKQATKETVLQPFCVACQIGLERAASPEIGRTLASTTAVERWLPTTDRPHALDFRFIATSPRAPPAF
jgi:hypothetical protein